MPHQPASGSHASPRLRGMMAPPGGYRSFLAQCQLIFQLQPQTFPTDVARVAYVITQLTGRARRWGTAAWSADLPYLQTSGELQRVFDRSVTGLKAGRELLCLRQGHDSVSNYAIDFHKLATDSGWEGRDLVDAFLYGLVEGVKDELLTRDLPDKLERIIALAIRIDARLEDRRRVTRARSPPPRRQEPRRRPSLLPRLPRSEVQRYPPLSPRGESEAMMVDRSRISPEERGHRQRDQACFSCGEEGHFARGCLLNDHAH